MRWAFGTVAAVLAAIVVLPGIASAHHVNLDGSVTCESGNFEIHANYSGGGNNKIIVVSVNNDVYDIDEGDMVTDLPDNDANLPANQPAVDEDYTENGQGINTTISGLVDLDPDGSTDDDEFNFSTDRDRFEIDGHGGTADSTDALNSFFAIDGHYDDVVNLANGGSITLATQMYAASNESDLDDSVPGTGNGLEDSDSFTVNVESFSDCIEDVCIEGQEGGFENGTQYEWLNGEDGLCVQINACVDGVIVGETLPEGQTVTGTDDCGPVKVCVQGDLEVFTEFEVNEDNIEGDGTCDGTPIVTNNFPNPGGFVTPLAPVIQVAAAVSQVLPARLPSTGMGPDATSSSFSLGAALAVALLGLGGMTALVARRQES